MDLTVSADICQAWTLPSAFYKSPEAHEKARELIFAKSWQFAGDSDDIRQPGAVKPFTMLEGCLDEPMVLTRDMKDQIHLLSNVCTHRGMAVVEGCGNERFLRCRYHGRRFGLDGKFQHMPEFEGVCDFPRPSDDLARPAFGQWGKLLFAGVAPRAGFEETFGPILDRLRWLPIEEFLFDVEFSRDYLVRANWALYVDNFLEGFHIPFIHQSLNEVLDYENYTSELFDWCNLQLAVASPGDEAFDLPSGSPDFGQQIGAYYWWIFPNTMLNFYPWGLSVNVIKPLAHDLTKVSAIRYVWKSERLGRGAGGDLDRVEREDDVVVELVQKGVRSRFYDKGRYSPRREQNTHHFHQLVAAAMRD